MRLNVAGNGRGIFPAVRNIALVAALSLALGGCFTKTLNRGAVISPDSLQQVQVGASREEIQLVLGTPSTTSVVDNETYYYISQKEQQTAFLPPDVVEQCVVAVYFDKDGRVAKITDYGLKDGKVFDFISRKTRTGGSDYGFISQIIRGATKPSLGL